MREPTRGLGFAQEALLEVLDRLRLEVRVQHQGLDRDLAPDLGVAPQVHHAHRALAQLALDLEAAQHRLLRPRAAENQGAGAAAAGHGAAQRHRVLQLLVAPDALGDVAVAATVAPAVAEGLGGLREALAPLVVESERVDAVDGGIVGCAAAQAAEGLVELAAGAVRLAELAVGLAQVGLELADRAHQRALAAEHGVAGEQRGQRRHQRDPGGLEQHHEQLDVDQHDRQQPADGQAGGQAQTRQDEHQVDGHQREHEQARRGRPGGHPQQVALQQGRDPVGARHDRFHDAAGGGDRLDQAGRGPPDQHHPVAEQRGRYLARLHGRGRDDDERGLLRAAVIEGMNREVAGGAVDALADPDAAAGEDVDARAYPVRGP